jgi:hypothetical protein
MYQGSLVVRVPLYAVREDVREDVASTRSATEHTHILSARHLPADECLMSVTVAPHTKIIITAT